MATVEVAFTPLPAHVRTARLVATAVARRSGVDEALLDEVRLAVGEACSRAVEAHRRHCPAEPIRIEMSDLGERFEVIVRDAVPSAASAQAGNRAGDEQASSNGAVRAIAADNGASFPAGFGLAVIRGLADDVRISATGSGVSVRMSWPAVVAAQALPTRRSHIERVTAAHHHGYDLISKTLGITSSSWLAVRVRRLPATCSFRSAAFFRSWIQEVECPGISSRRLHQQPL